MESHSSKMKNQLRSNRNDFEDDEFSERRKMLEPEKKKRKSKGLRNLFGILLILLMLYYSFGRNANSNSNWGNFFNTSGTIFNTYSTDLLDRMNIRMAEMGYTGLTHDDLIKLRNDGLTATYISNVRALGYTDLTLEQAVSLAKANVSSAFIAMMIELGYELSVSDILTLRSAGVTAHYTSNLHDLGYTEVTLDQLVRLRRIGVTIPMIERLRAERGNEITMEEIIRHRISNQ